MAEKVIIRLMGGLGNQLFQYAAALQLANGNSRNVYCDLINFDTHKIHNGFLLHKLLDIKINAGKNLKFANPHISLSAIADPDADVSSLATSNTAITLKGYFQNTKNFTEVLPYLKTGFEKKHDIDNARKELIKAIGAAMDDTLVGLHIRLGDYLHPEYRNIFGTPSLESVIHLIKKHYQNDKTRIVVFSDGEPPSIPGATIYRSNKPPADADIDELVKISAMDYLICSNSTFGYWGGLLSPYNKKIHIPSPWFKNASVDPKHLLLGNIETYPTTLS